MVMIIALTAACSVDTTEQDETLSPEGGVVEIPFIGSGSNEADDEGITDATDAEDEEGGTPAEPAPASGAATAPLEIVTDALAKGFQTKDYKQKLEAKGGSKQYEWIATKGLPANGLELKGYRIKGTPEKAGSFPITLTLKDEKTGETLSKDFILEVAPFVQEDIIIQVERMGEDGQWAFVDDFENGVRIDNKVRRIKLSVKAQDGGVPHAPRYFWKVTSPEQKLGVFVPPIVKTEGAASLSVGPQAGSAYLMAWTERGTGGTAQLDVTEWVDAEGNKLSLDGTTVTVVDDFGNQAGIRFDKLSVQEARWQECRNMEAPKVTLVNKSFGEMKLEDVLEKKPYDMELKVEGGVPPYRWSWSKVRKASVTDDSFAEQVGSMMAGADAADEIVVPGKDWLMSAWGKADGDESERYNFHFMVWPVLDDPYQDPEGDVTISATDVCGRTAEKSVTLKVVYPEEQLADLFIDIWLDNDGGQPNDVDGDNTWVKFKFLTDGANVAEWRVTFHSENLNENLAKHSQWVGGDNKKMLSLINGVEVETYDSCRKVPCASLDADVHDALFEGKYWKAHWTDHTNQVTDEHNNEDNITANFDGFSTHKTIWYRRGDLFPVSAWSGEEAVDSKPVDADCDLTPEEIDDGWSCL
jgi:hypothetical protein